MKKQKRYRIDEYCSIDLKKDLREQDLYYDDHKECHEYRNKLQDKYKKHIDKFNSFIYHFDIGKTVGKKEYFINAYKLNESPDSRSNRIYTNTTKSKNRIRKLKKKPENFNKIFREKTIYRDDIIKSQYIKRIKDDNFCIVSDDFEDIKEHDILYELSKDDLLKLSIQLKKEYDYINEIIEFIEEEKK